MLAASGNSGKRGEPASIRSAEQSIHAAIRRLPRGSVASYGDIAARVGLPRHARLVARVLAGLADPSVPWHRVLRAGYRIAFAPGSEGFRRQRQRLEAEGHTVRDNGRVVPAMRAVDLDRALWGDFL